MSVKPDSARVSSYGVCVNPKCAVSSFRPELDRLYSLLDEIDRTLQLKESFEYMLPPLTAFVGYFQGTAACMRCQKPIVRKKQNAVGIEDPEEKARIELANEALHALRELQALGIIPAQPRQESSPHVTRTAADPAGTASSPNHAQKEKYASEGTA